MWQCDARPTVTFPATRHHCPLARTNYTAWWQRHVCKLLAQGCTHEYGIQTSTTYWLQIQQTNHSAMSHTKLWQMNRKSWLFLSRMYVCMNPVSQNKYRTLYSCPSILQILVDFLDSFTDRLSSNYVMNRSSKFPLHLKRYYLVKH